MILKTVCAFLALLLELFGVYGDGEFKWNYGYVSYMQVQHLYMFHYNIVLTSHNDITEICIFFWAIIQCPSCMLLYPYLILLSCLEFVNFPRLILIFSLVVLTEISSSCLCCRNDLSLSLYATY